MDFTPVPLHSFYLMVVVIGLLFIASIICAVKKHNHPEHDYTELWLRIRSWWVMIGLIFVVLVLSPTATIVFFGFLSFLALKEFLSITPIRLSDRKTLFWAYLSIPIQYYWVNDAWYGMFIIFIPIYLFLILPTRMALTGETRGFIRSAGVIHWATMLTVFSISHIPFLLVLPEKNTNAGPIGLVLFLIFITQLNDVAQYVWGKSFGRKKIIPKVSPNKTWAGFIGGICSIMLVASISSPWLTPMSWLEGLVAGIIIGIGGFFGDVVISAVKRDLQIKDSGTLIPGHGGILDRMDSLMFTAPLFFHFIYYLHY